MAFSNVYNVTGVVVLGGLLWGSAAAAQEVILLDDGCYEAEVDGVVGEIHYDDAGNLLVFDGDTVLGYAPEECHEIIAAQEASASDAPLDDALPPPPDYIPPPPPGAAADSGVKNANTVPYCDELPAGTTQQCQQRMTLDLPAQ